MLAGLALVVACSHGERFSATAAAEPNPPRPALGLQQLTVDGAGDWAPAWLDSGTIGFSWRDPEHVDHDRCIAIMPVAVRRITRRLCGGGARGRDSANAVFSHAFGPGGQVAYVEAEGAIASMASARFLAVRPVSGGAPVVMVSFPRLMNDGVLHQGAIEPGWTSDSTLVYIGTRIVYVTGVPEAVDTTETPIEAVRLTTTASGASSVVVVPNTASIVTLAVDPASHIAYAVFQDQPDTVFALDVLTGARTFAADLSALGPVRDLSVYGGRMVAVVGGASSHRSGNLAVIDLPGGTPVVLPPATTGVFTGYFFGRPALSPSRDRIVAEGYSYTIAGTPADTIVQHASDLYLVAVP
jgi:hypothetical protein